MKTGYLIALVVLLGATGWFFLRQESESFKNEVVSDVPATLGEGNGASVGDVLQDATSTPGTNQATSTATPAESAVMPAALVTYTDEGYSPSPVTIKKGQPVTFKNKSARDSWVASALHPTHALYPEKSGNDCLGSSFDACRGVPSGGEWSFTFNTLGTWKYHDHLRPTKFGSVIVE